MSILAGAAGQVQDVLDQTASVPPLILLVALGLETCQTLLNALAWRNILRAAYPYGGARFKPVLGAYAGGVGLNAIVPAQGGTVAMFGLYRAQIQGSTVLGLVGAGVVQSAFFLVAGALLYTTVLASGQAGFGIDVQALRSHPLLGLAGTLLAALIAAVLWRRGRSALATVRQGAAGLSDPGRYARQVLSLQVASFLARLGVTATFMHAYDVPVTPRSVLLVIAVNSISTTFAVTPGGVGTQQALAAVALSSYASASAVTAFSLSQQVVITGWDVSLGIVLLWWTVGTRATRSFPRRPKARTSTSGEASVPRLRPPARVLIGPDHGDDLMLARMDAHHSTASRVDHRDAAGRQASADRLVDAGRAPHRIGRRSHDGAP